MTRDRIAMIVLLAVAVGGYARSCGIGSDLAAANAAANLLRTEALVGATELAGWEVRLVDATSDLGKRLQEQSDRGDLLEKEKSELARQAETLNGRISALADMYADARGQITILDGRIFASDASTTIPDSVTAEIDDGLLRGNLAFYPPSSLALEYELHLAIALAFVDAPDGRMMATAMSDNPRVELRYGEVFYQPAPPVEYCSVGTRVTWGLGGLGVGAAAQLIKSILGGSP